MGEKAKSPVVILVALLFLSSLLAAGGFFLFQKEHAKNLSLVDELDDIKTRLRVTESKLEESKKLMSAMDQRLKDTRAQIETLNTDLAKEKSAKEEAMSQISQLRTELEQQKTLRSNLEDKLMVAQKDVKEAQDQLKDLDARKGELETKVAELQVKSADLENKMQSVELGKIVVTPEKTTSAKQKKAKAKEKKVEIAKEEKKPATPPAKNESGSESGALEGKVLVVNRDYNFVVINLGSKDKVGVDDLFAVYNDNKYAGDLKISKVHDSMSAADLVTDELKNVVKEGDRVVRKGE